MANQKTDAGGAGAPPGSDRPTGAKAEMAGCVCFSLRKAARTITQVYDAALAESGLRITQFSLLAMLNAHGRPRRISDLARDLVMDRTTLTRNLRPLEREGLLTISAGEDRRERLATITEEGTRRVRLAAPRWRTAQAHVLDLFGEERWLDIRSDLNRALGAALTDERP